MNIAVLFQGLAVILWIIFLGLVVLAVARSSRGTPMRSALTNIIIAGVLAILITSISAGLVFIQPEERGVVISAVSPTGFRAQPLQPGIRWIIPFAETVVRYPISKQTYTMSG